MKMPLADRAGLVLEHPLAARTGLLLVTKACRLTLPWLATVPVVSTPAAASFPASVCGG